MKTKEKILKGAKDYLVRQGQAGFTVRAIAAEAGVNQGLVHHYFGSKENLIVALIESEADRPFNELKEQFDGKDPADILSLIMDRFFLNPGFTNLFLELINLSYQSEAVKAKVKSIMTNRKQVLGEALGLSDPNDRTLLVGSIFGTVLQNRVIGDIDVHACVKRLLDILGLTQDRPLNSDTR